MKKITCKVIIDGNREVEKLWLGSNFLGMLRVNAEKWPKGYLKVIRSFSKYECYIFIAK